MSNTNNTHLHTITNIFPPEVQDEGEPLGVWYHLYLYDDDSIIFGRDDVPRFSAPVIFDTAAGIYRIDRDRVEWIDDKPDNADDILNAADKKERLRRLVKSAQADAEAKEREQRESSEETARETANNSEEQQK